MVVFIFYAHARRWRPGWFRVVRIVLDLCSILALRSIVLTILNFAVVVL
jgi:hypothetical protein